MRYLLDTTVVSDFARGVTAVLTRLKATSKDDTAICIVTAMEIEYGLLDPTPTTTEGTSTASNAILSRSASTRVETVLMVFIDIALLEPSEMASGTRYQSGASRRTKTGDLKNTDSLLITSEHRDFVSDICR